MLDEEVYGNEEWTPSEWIPMRPIGTRVRVIRDVTGVIVGHGAMTGSTGLLLPTYLIQVDENFAAWHGDRRLWVRVLAVYPPNIEAYE